MFDKKVLVITLAIAVDKKKKERIFQPKNQIVMMVLSEKKKFLLWLIFSLLKSFIKTEKKNK